MAEPIKPIGLQQPPDLLSAPQSTPRPASTGVRFSDALGEALSASRPVHVSAHATQRLEERGIELGSAELARIEGALDEAGRKGARDTVLILDEAALVASVTNRTIVTVVEPATASNTVFTNIDSVVMVG